MNKTNSKDVPPSPILSAEKARLLMAGGWAAADLHVHTLHSYDVIPTRQVEPLVLYEKARQLGMTYVAFTDHDSMDAYDRIGWTREGIVPAVEVKILDPRRVGHTVHINVYCLDRAQFGEIMKIAKTAQDIELFVAYLKDEKLPFIYNHPFWHEAGETPNLRAVVEIAELFPVLEYNMGRISRINRQALKLAALKGKGIVAATDSHIGEIGRAFTLARGGTFREFFDGIREGSSFIIPADLNLSRLKTETGIRIRRLFNKAGWLFPKDTLTMDTGIALLDGIIGRMAGAKPDAIRIADRILTKTMEAVSQTGVPGLLYIRYQKNLAHRIGELLEDSELAA